MDNGGVAMVARVADYAALGWFHAGDYASLIARALSKNQIKSNRCKITNKINVIYIIDFIEILYSRLPRPPLNLPLETDITPPSLPLARGGVV